jgi:hypothetical protein
MAGNMTCVDKDIVDNLPPSPKMGIVTEEDAKTGKGQFDKYMRAVVSQLGVQYDEGRIKGADLANAFVEVIPPMMESANKFVLGEVAARLAADKAKFDLKIAEYQLLKVQAEVSKLCTEENEMKLTGKVQRGKLRAETELIETQESELKKNGASKRALEGAQKKVADEQVNLYRAQGKGFADKNRNDTFKTVMNAWAVDAVEVREEVHPPAHLDGPNIDNTLATAKQQAGIA